MLTTEEQILEQRRRPHRHVIAKGALHAGDYTRGVKWQAKEKYRKHNEQSERESTQGVSNVATEIVIEQTEAGGGNFHEFEPGMYDAEVSDISEVVNPFEDDKTQLQFTFDVAGYQNEDGTVANKRAWANPVWNQKSKLYGWAAAILGKVPEKGEAFRASILIGKPCRIVLNEGTNLKGETIIKLTDVLGPMKAAPKKGKLTERLAADPPAGATVVEESIDYCKEPDCKRVADGYTGKGSPYCDEHMP